MQEIKKRRILIASVLKPVDDTRMAEKIGNSLATYYDVHIIGYAGKQHPHSNNLTVHCLPAFNRLSFRRIMIPWKILSYMLNLRPSILIITTHELLIPAVIARLLAGCKVVYDVQENYYRNILYTSAFPFLLRPFVAGYVRIKEKITSPFVHHFLLAERAYAEEMPFLPSCKTVIENKFKRRDGGVLPRKSLSDGKIHLLFSGTLAESTGVFTAIDLASKLHALVPDIQLTIIGYCAQKAERERIMASIAHKPFIQLVGGEQLVPHQDILQVIQVSDFGIIAYPPNPSTDNAIPTKLYEYLGNKLPILLINNVRWEAICAPYQAAISFQAGNIDAPLILKRIKTDSFYRLPPAADLFWEREEEKLFTVLSTL